MERRGPPDPYAVAPRSLAKRSEARRSRTAWIQQARAAAARERAPEPTSLRTLREAFDVKKRPTEREERCAAIFGTLTGRPLWDKARLDDLRSALQAVVSDAAPPGAQPLPDAGERERELFEQAFPESREKVGHRRPLHRDRAFVGCLGRMQGWTWKAIALAAAAMAVTDEKLWEPSKPKALAGEAERLRKFFGRHLEAESGHR